MAFKETLKALIKKHDIPNGKAAILMGVSCSQVYRYLEGSSEPKWEGVLSLLRGLGYKLKIDKEQDVPRKNT